MLVDTEGTSLAHLGRLLEQHRPAFSTVARLAEEAVLVSPLPLEAQTCSSTRLVAGTAGGCDGGSGGAWRVLLGGEGSRWAREQADHDVAAGVAADAGATSGTLCHATSRFGLAATASSPAPLV